MNVEIDNSIKFTSNPIYSFYALYHNCMLSPDASKKALEGFGDERLSRLTDAIPEKGTIRRKSNLILQNIGKKNITDYASLKLEMSRHLSAQDVEKLDKTLQPACEAYLIFYNQNKDCVDKNIETLQEMQSFYKDDLKNLYKCFSIPSNKQCSCFLNPFPKDKIMDGISNPENVSMDYSLNKTEDSNNYIGNSEILKRKASTPFHETTHFLFFNSQLKKDIEQEKTPAIKNLVDVVIKSFEKNNAKTPKSAEVNREQMKLFAVGAINEAFAACSSVLYNEKNNGKIPDDNEWYHGWKQANDLTRQMYPVFKEYVSTGRPFDNVFINRLNVAIKMDHLKQMMTDKKNISKLASDNALTESKSISSSAKVPHKPQPTAVNFNVLRLHKDKKQNG